MKAYISDFNGILTELKKRVDVVRDPRDADVLILWQDVRGPMKTLCDINKEYMNKPVVVVQHGRGATRDYLAPNNFPMLANRFCVWGQKEKDRLDKAGFGDRAVITGSPLVQWTRKRQDRQPTAQGKKIITFVPVITGHEEVENIEVALELKKIEYDYVLENLRRNRRSLKEAWHAWLVDPECATENQVPYRILHKDWNVVHKLTPNHDKQLYQGEYIETTVTHSKHIENTAIILNNTDCVVGLEEGTFQLMATALGVPTVIVDGFKYGRFGGVDNYETEVIKTDATAFCELKDLRQTIEEEMNNPQKRKDARERVIQEEFDPYPDKDPIELIIDVASELAWGDIRSKQLVETV